jgi:hypothetical protein
MEKNSGISSADSRVAAGLRGSIRSPACPFRGPKSSNRLGVRYGLALTLPISSARVSILLGKVHSLCSVIPSTNFVVV